MSLKKSLLEIGFTIYESSIIAVLAESDSPTAKDIAQVTKVPKNKVYELLEKLQHDGVIAVLTVKPKRYRLVDLKKTITDRHQEEQQRFTTAVRDIETYIQKPKRAVAEERDMWVTEGEQAMLKHIQTVLQDTQKESLALVNVWAGSTLHYQAVEAAVARGVQFYFLGPNDPKAKQIIAKYRALGVQVREHPVETTGYSIFDSTQVQMRIYSNTLVSLWLDNKYLATILREHFFQQWKQAKDLKS